MYPEDLKYSQTHEWVKVDKDIAKRLLDFGFHPPTIYFPLIVQEAPHNLSIGRLDEVKASRTLKLRW